MWYPLKHLMKTLNENKENAAQNIMYVQKFVQIFWEQLEETNEVFKRKEFCNYVMISETLQGLPKHFHEDTINKLKEVFSNGNIVHICLCIFIIDEFEKFCQINKLISSDSTADWFQLQAKKLQSSCEHSTVLLSAAQLETIIQLLLTIYSNELKPDILLQESRRFALQRLEWCLAKLETGISKDTDSLTEQVPGNFMVLMDNVLELVIEIDVDILDREGIVSKYNEAKSEIDELLCHAMSIARVALPEDLKIIKAGSCKVLNLCTEVLKECSEDLPDRSLCNLLLDALSDALCMLEQRVNTAVLRLLLAVFQDSNAPLKELYSYCVNPKKSVTKRQSDDLDNLIIQYDLHVDRIIQIGLFAVACSTDTERVLMMRSCLASLESLEGELVPALTALYLESESISRLHADILCKHWYDEVNILQNLIHLIVDPAAFSSVVLETCKIQVEKIQHVVNKKNEPITSEICLPVSKQAHTLVRHLKTCFPEIQSELTESCIKYHHLLSDIIKECDCAVKVLLCDTPTNITNSKRVLKRYVIMINTLRKLHSALAQSEEKSKSNTSNESNSESVYLNEEKDRILQKKVPESSKPPQTLALLMLRGEMLRKERSILYQTPKKSKMISVSSRLSNLGNRKVLSIYRNEKIDSRQSTRNSFSFNITEILEKVSNCHLSRSNF